MVFRVTYMAALLGVALIFRSTAVSAAAMRPKIAPIAQTSAAAAQTYTIVDVGAPPVATYPASSPVGFNNTGQMFGVALRAAKSDRRSYAADTDCLVWTGSRFIDLTPSLSVQGCTPNAMSSAALPGGSVSVVGSFTDIHHSPTYGENFDAFSAIVTGNGTAKVLSYYDHSPAQLQGVNASGTAVGYSYNATNSGATFVTTPPQELTWLQPGCMQPVAGCLEPFNFIYNHTLNGEPAVQCPFGGCTITDAGAVLGFDAFTKAYALYAGGTANSSGELPLPFPSSFVVSINDARQVLYFSRAVPGVVPSVYDVAAGTSIGVPPIAGKSCANYYPISMNDVEEVLGYTSRCSGSDFYWVWDPVNGTRSVNAALPASSFTVTPLGVNDSGQILVTLLPATGPAHWGMLDPPSTPATRHARSSGVADVR